MNVHLFPEQPNASFLVGAPHAAHTPPQQIPEAHAFPSIMSPVWTQAGCPVLHEILPVWHALLLGEQATPALHVVQAPSKQTSSVPHGAPFGALATDTHAGIPEAQEMIPLWHALPGRLHGAPATHATEIAPPSRELPSPESSRRAATSCCTSEDLPPQCAASVAIHATAAYDQGLQRADEAGSRPSPTRLEYRAVKVVGGKRQLKIPGPGVNIPSGSKRSLSLKSSRHSAPYWISQSSRLNDMDPIG